jgi:hypothetical protein
MQALRKPGGLFFVVAESLCARLDLSAPNLLQGRRRGQARRGHTDLPSRRRALLQFLLCRCGADRAERWGFFDVGRLAAKSCPYPSGRGDQQPTQQPANREGKGKTQILKA